MKNKPLLVVGVLLAVFGMYRSDLISLPLMPSPSITCNEIEVEPPVSEELKTMALNVAKCLQDGSPERTVDGTRLARLYNDMSVLIALDEDDKVIDSTAAIAEANLLAGKLLKINMKGKYPGLSEACDILLKKTVSENSVPLDNVLRSKAVQAFQALAWGCLEGAK